MVSERALQEAFSKIKQEFTSLKSEINSLKSDLGEVKNLKDAVDNLKTSNTDVNQDDHVEVVKAVDTVETKKPTENAKEELVQVQDDADSYY